MPSTEQTEQKDELPEIAARFAAMPAFPMAVREYNANLTRFRQGPRLINKLVSHSARWRIASYLIYLSADRERYGPNGGATYGNLLDMCSRGPAISSSILKTVLLLLQITGFVKVKRNLDDRRSKFYQPTGRMDGFVHRWFEYATKVLDILEPEMRRAQMLREDPGFPHRFFVSSGRAHRTATPLVSRFPEYTDFFGGRDGAGATMLAILRADIDGAPVPSRAKLAKLYGFSKTQITNVLIEGEARGFFTLDAAGIPAPTQYLHDLHNKWVAIELAFYAQHMRPAEKK